MAYRVAPRMVEEGSGRIVNVTTTLDTMNRAHTSPYGASKAALEMATEVSSREVEGTGLLVPRKAKKRYQPSRAVSGCC